ncbi:39827_t:CDS:2, partial [Gigaspora margarita]
MDIESLYSQVKFKSLRYCSKPVPVINYYNNDPVPEVINNNESESVAELKNNFIKIQSPDYQLVSETIIKNHRNPAKINIAKDIIKGNYYNLEICFKNMHKEIGNLLKKIDTENTKLNVKLWGPMAYEDSIKEVHYSLKNKIKFP